jgi:ABC-type methionine transport system ATPase subunit
MITLVDVRLDRPRGGEPIVSEANLDVARGEVVMIVGEAGPETARIVAAALGELSPSAGRIEIMGRDVAKLRRASLRLMRRRIGIVPQELCLLDERTAQDNVVMPLEIDGLPRATTTARATELLELLGLADFATVAVADLSPAQRQRVAVARALVRKPDLVIADHPTSLQDEAGTQIILGAFAMTGCAVLMFDRDSSIALDRGWRTFEIVDSAMREIVNVRVSEPEIPNVLPFPISARTAGVA